MTEFVLDPPPDGFDVRVVDVTGSTNADLAAQARAGAPAGRVLVAVRQTAGRGRLDRSWTSPPGAGLTFSVLLRPEVPAARLGWLPLLTGLAAVDAVAATTGLTARLKWPNDVLVDGRKLAGILAEAIPVPGGGAGGAGGGGPAVVVGIGLNVTTALADLPPAATSLAAALASADGVRADGARADGARADGALADGRAGPPRRGRVLGAFLRALAARLAQWAADPAGLAADYAAACATVGERVRVELPGGGAVAGIASAIDRDGRLVVDGRPFGAGDVVHLR